MKKIQFLKMALRDLRVNDINVIFSKETLLNQYGDIRTGFYSHSKKELVVDRKNEYWFQAFVHEYCHFLQFKENCRVVRVHSNHVGLWNAWIHGGIELSRRKRIRSFRAIRNLELDCEKRVVKMIKEYNLPLDVEWHIRVANYTMIMYKRVDMIKKWDVDLPKDDSYKVFYSMPTRFLSLNSYDKIPHKILNIYKDNAK